jgi:hypothetical protein
VKEVWFKGQHTDIGGGAPPPELPADAPKPKIGDPPNFSKLSNITLRWMVRQCLHADANIIFDQQTLECYRDSQVGVLEKDPWTTPTGLIEQAALDKQDIDHIPYDAMEDHPMWRILEYIPTYRQVPHPDKMWLSVERGSVHSLE